ncbi:hypothetical protein [Streptomyces sp. NBC_01443]|uniref:hypothetical protein n=1 Tax=Streptomyces sp. NBC_01443 TaxID=2903868 RepID=UPI002251FC5A|nr:hypothetical protein [Streptomyces sp. NBC_01443]MCX4633343.1 hypothetical protein [Streptomyces sp. NBC_01443]
MSNPSCSIPEKKPKPGWSLTVLLFGAVNALLAVGDIWSWWALIWGPLLAIGVGAVVYEWRLLTRSQWRMSSAEWMFLAIAHVGLAASLAAVLGIFRP